MAKQKQETKDILKLEDQIQQNFDDLIDSGDTSIILNAFMVNQFFKNENLKVNSRVKMLQIAPLTKLFAFSKQFDVPFLEVIGNNILQLQISAYGLGRKETIGLFGTVNQTGVQETPFDPSKKDVFK